MWDVWLTRTSRMSFKGWCRTALKAICTKQRGGVSAQKWIPSDITKKNTLLLSETTEQGITAYKDVQSLANAPLDRVGDPASGRRPTYTDGRRRCEIPENVGNGTLHPRGGSPAYHLLTCRFLRLDRPHS